MAEATEKRGQFAEAACSFLDFHFRVARDKFKLEAFSSSMKSKGLNELPKRWGVTCLTQLPDDVDYHVHFGWDESDEKDLSLWVSYHAGPLPLQPEEKEPFAEQFMPWLGEFFVGEYANADFQGRIAYPNTVRQSRYLLPVKVGIISGLETSIDGISIDFPSRPHGVENARLTIGAKNLTIVMNGMAKLKFDSFNVLDHLSSLSYLALGLTDLRRQS